MRRRLRGMFDLNRSRPRDIDRWTFRLFLVAVLVADYVVLIGKEPFSA